MLVEAYQLLDGWIDDFRCITSANLWSDNIGSKMRGSMSYIPAVGDPSSVRLFRSMSRTQSMARLKKAEVGRHRTPCRTNFDGFERIGNPNARHTVNILCK